MFLGVLARTIAWGRAGAGHVRFASWRRKVVRRIFFRRCGDFFGRCQSFFGSLLKVVEGVLAHWLWVCIVGGVERGERIAKEDKAGSGAQPQKSSFYALLRTLGC